MSTKKWGFLNDYIKEALKYSDNYASIGRKMKEKYDLDISDDTARKIISSYAAIQGDSDLDITIETKSLSEIEEGKKEVQNCHVEPYSFPSEFYVPGRLVTTTGISSSKTDEGVKDKLYEWGFPQAQQQSKRGTLPNPFLGGDPNNVLIIGDLHEPFCLDDYLFFCRVQQETYNCGTIVFIGDIIDNHFSSYHETDPDGFSAGEELNRAIHRINEWYQVFPDAKIIIGNHDRMVYRKAHTGGISKAWIRNYDEVLRTPTWEFLEEWEFLDVLYIHGENGTARSKIKKELQSIVQGHLHTQGYVEFIVGKNFRVFGMQVGTGINREAYAMAYAKRNPKPIISCGVVLNGKQPVLVPMEL